MFPVRYFPSRYFARRYWPKLGATTVFLSGNYPHIRNDRTSTAENQRGDTVLNYRGSTGGSHD